MQRECSIIKSENPDSQSRKHPDFARFHADSRCRRRGRLLASGIGAALIAGVFFAPIRFSISDSAAPAGIYRIVAQRQIRRGELALVCLPPKIAAFGFARKYIARGFCPGGFEPVGKVIAGLPGDQIEPAKALERDGKGRALAHIAGPVIVPPGTVWLYGSQPDSWDSRYYGAVPETDVKERLMPLWVWR